MGVEKNIIMNQFNGTDYDTLYPKTLGSQITGAVPVASGGTGGTNATSGMYNLLNGMSAIAPATNDLFPFKDVSGSTSGLVTLTNLITAMGNNGVITTSNLSTQASNLGFTKIQTGSYVGTGTYGADNPCSLTFDFAPIIAMILYRTTYDYTTPYFIPLSLGGDTTTFGGSGGGLMYNIMSSVLLTTTYTRGHGFGANYGSNIQNYGKKSEDGKTFFWYIKAFSTSDQKASYQLNETGTYYYIAFG